MRTDKGNTLSKTLIDCEPLKDTLTSVPVPSMWVGSLSSNCEMLQILASIIANTKVDHSWGSYYYDAYGVVLLHGVIRLTSHNSMVDIDPELFAERVKSWTRVYNFKTKLV